MVKVMQISTVNISQTMTDRANISLVIQQKVMAFPLAYLHFILAHSLGRGHANLDCKYFANSDR